MDTVGGQPPSAGFWDDPMGWVSEKVDSGLEWVANWTEDGERALDSTASKMDGLIDVLDKVNAGSDAIGGPKISAEHMGAMREAVDLMKQENDRMRQQVSQLRGIANGDYSPSDNANEEGHRVNRASKKRKPNRRRRRQGRDEHSYKVVD